ncbi:BglG family transcription antiterminator [Peribacillus deserti]|uniref:PTS fructose transporter subunit IIA n=1 Tax=Peribacillus deserti TaxID=673318 RepID=A0A2N5LZU0_9BACI|nr:BglG family transcription antiterminator [Peribacillus deserti]PLT27543.1 PTS fructose transporter subunit IIA [Peribacillus deserti]
MLNTRMTAILRELMGAKSCITGEQLAAAIDVTSRTIRNDMKELDSILSYHGGNIRSKRGTGYQLMIEDEQAFLHFLKENFQRDSNREDHIPSVPEERVQYLIKRLLLTDQYVKLDHLADEMFISKSTIQNDLRDVKKLLNLYGIALEKRPNYGIKLKGNEVNLRYCMSEYIFNRAGTHPDINNLGVSLLTAEEMQVIKDIILKQVKDHSIDLSDISLNNLVIHIAIAYKRIQNSNYVSLSPAQLQEITSQLEYDVAHRIIKNIEYKLDVRFPDTEIAYIAIHLLGTRTMANLNLEEAELQEYMDDDIHLLSKKIVDSIEKKLGLGIGDDKELLVSLNLHLKPALYRFRYKMNLRNPMLDEIKATFPIAFEGGIIAGVVIKEELNIDINEHEIGYIALHIGAAMERRTLSTIPKKCLIVCASGLGSAKLLSYKLQSVFGTKIRIAGTIEYYKLQDFPIQSVDFIISTIPISEAISVPVIEVNTFLGHNDFQKIESQLKTNQSQTTNYTSEDLVFLQKKFETREEVLSFLTERLMKLGLASESFLESVLERESYSPTSFGNLVAIPHPAIPQTNTTFWAVCTLQKPIKWGDKRVQFICLLSIEKNSTGDFQSMYNLLGSLLDDSTKVQQFLKCRTYKEFIQVLHE